MLSIKVILAIIFVVTGGAVFSSQFGKNKLAVVLAAMVSIVSAYYLFSEIKKDIIKELKEDGTVKEVSVKKEPIPELEEVLVRVEPKVEKIVPKKTNENSIVIDGLRYENRPFTKEYDWDDAEKHCSDMKLDGYSDWRLPKRDELTKLLTKTKNQGKNGKYYIREEFVDNLESGGWFWTNTKYKEDSSSAWVVYFNLGSDGWGNETNTYYVLCVSGQ